VNVTQLSSRVIIPAVTLSCHGTMAGRQLRGAPGSRSMGRHEGGLESNTLRNKLTSMPKSKIWGWVGTIHKPRGLGSYKTEVKFPLRSSGPRMGGLPERRKHAGNDPDRSLAFGTRSVRLRRRKNESF
jgi:hypothetical protein